jgi:N-dimethylarginine dimethylaminohydrolase
MTWSVYQHWDPLKVCVVGRSYPPEFYSWIKVPHVRSLFEKIAIETEEDYQNIIKKLQEFNVTVHRPDLPENIFIGGRYYPPPMTPRDCMIMIGQTFYKGYQHQLKIKKSYSDVKDPSWPECNSYEEFLTLPQHIQDECNEMHHFAELRKFYSSYDKIFDLIEQQGNKVIQCPDIISAPGAFITRVGKDLYVGTESYQQDQKNLQNIINSEFTDTRNHIVNTGGHSDAVFCPVTPGLIISLRDVTTYAETFPGWEVVFLPNQSWNAVKPFLSLKEKNKGKWWIPGFEHDQDVIDCVEQWLGHWTGYVEETVFDVNMLIIDPKNVMVFNYNKQVFDALDRYGITPHVVPFRHRYFWDGGIHCVTSDIHREGIMQDYFPNRINDVR